MSEQPPDDLSTPWHWIIATNARDNPQERLCARNPAAWQALHGRDGSWDDWLLELIREGATDDQIFAGDWLDVVGSFPVQRYVRARLAELRGLPPVTDDRTPLARQMIPMVERTYQEIKRRTGKPPSKRATAGLVGIDRGTLGEWIERGWMAWPPRPPAGS